jgi:hypothetical protein
MDDPRRVKVPWYSWRWRLGLLVSTLLFALLAVSSLREIRTGPASSIVFGALFLAFALLFARQVWRERHPLRRSGSTCPECGSPLPAQPAI